MSEPNEDWQAQQFADELVRLQAILDSLEAARTAGVPEQHLSNLAAECGASRDFYKGHK